MTEREKIELQREAFALGHARWMGTADLCPKLSPCDVCEAARARAAEMYPMPQQPRVAVMPCGAKYRVMDGELQVWLRGDQWINSCWTASEITTLADLIANPLEDAE